MVFQQIHFCVQLSKLNVKSVDLLRETMKVSLDSSAPSDPLKTYRNCEIVVLRNGKGSREGIEIPDERPARYVEEKEEVELPRFSLIGYTMEEPDEEAPVRESIAPPEKDRSRRRPHHRGGRKRSGKADAQEESREQKPEIGKSEKSGKPGRKGEKTEKTGKPEKKGKSAGGKQPREQAPAQKKQAEPGQHPTSAEKKHVKKQEPKKAKPGQKTQPASRPAAGEEAVKTGGEAAKRHRPRHRGGRKRNGGAPKTEA